MKSLQLTAPAKINLTLDITGIRADGYHELVTVMHQISLSDTICLHSQEKGISLTSDLCTLPNDSTNLAWRAADLMLQRYLPGQGISIAITKRIPVGAGLAGGSTDAAAVIKGINQLFQLQLPLAELCECGAALGADVPFCIAGGTALCTGKGEIMQPLTQGPKLHMVLVKPPFSLFTAEVYRQYDTIGCSETHPNHTAFQNIWKHGEISSLSGCMGNVLEKVSIGLHPEIRLLLHRLSESGALVSQMTGSGPAVFGIFPDAASAQKAQQILSETYTECFVVESY